MPRVKLYELFDRVPEGKSATRVLISLGPGIDHQRVRVIVDWVKENVPGYWGFIDGRYPEIGGNRYLKLIFAEPSDAVLVKLRWG